MAEGFIGEIRFFCGNFAPSNWQICAGQTLAISQYTALFSILGTTFGGNGTTNFMLPDFRGRMPLSTGQSPGTSNYVLGQQGGSESTTISMSQMPAHTHQATAVVNASARAGQETPAGGVPAPAPSGTAIYASGPDGSTTMSSGMTTVTVQPAGSSLPLPTQPPYTCVNFIICINGIFPSRN
ncbi:MAG TPA: tail fiber protein [Vicinamibacterales bacterium]